MSSTPIAGVFNDGYIAEAYEVFRRDPSAVDESWHQLFRLAERIKGASTSQSADASLLSAAAGAASLAQAIRSHGHLAVLIDPLGSPRAGAVELAPEFHGTTEAELAAVPASIVGAAGSTAGSGDTADSSAGSTGSAADAIARLRERYSSTIGFETEHLRSDTERVWWREAIEGDSLRRPLSAEEKVAVLQRLSEVDGLERFIGRAFLGYKRFSIEGTDVLVPMLDAALEGVASAGAEMAVIGMAHRGRINVLAHILAKPMATIFEEFLGRHPMGNSASGTGDVKYHLGMHSERTLASGAEITVELVPNPSHLEFVNPVIAGVARAHQRTESGKGDESKVLPICLHGDAAFPGEGVVAETFNMSRLQGYRVGGTLHIIVNNQVGFTTDPRDARSTRYSSDLAKGFEVPVLHVNADDAESCIVAVRMGLAYRARFGKDIVIDLVGYRRHGHNEGDEPTYTQAQLYAKIKAHPTPREVWGSRLVSEGIVSEDRVREMERGVATKLEEIHSAIVAGQEDPAEHEASGGNGGVDKVDTTVAAERLRELNEQLLTWPDEFSIHPKLGKQLERRRAALDEERGIDWGHAEALAFASLLAEGTPIRLTGQDAERGTFSHRHAVLHDVKTGDRHLPLQHVGEDSGAFEIFNSPLSETAVMGFDYGFSVAAPEALVLWEAQFGDFVNVAQPIIDQFLVADRAKWGQDSSLVLLLPHGYEGQGPEHSSARLERFLQSAAEGNMRVASCTTPAQYFHILRRQASVEHRRPLILMQPKSLLRLPAAGASLSALAEGAFQPVLDDPVASQEPGAVRRLVFCTGKIYYDLAAAREEAGSDNGAGSVALVRVEELYPWPHEAVATVVDRYTGIEDVVWAQEEPKNMGAWSYVLPLLRASVGNVLPLQYIGRQERASPAEGYKTAHDVEQRRIIDTVLTAPQGAGARRRSTAGRA
jgi:2-oxoglutarate dehydrogenase E1 component